MNQVPTSQRCHIHSSMLDNTQHHRYFAEFFYPQQLSCIASTSKQFQAFVATGLIHHDQLIKNVMLKRRDDIIAETTRLNNIRELCSERERHELDREMNELLAQYVNQPEDVIEVANRITGLAKRGARYDISQRGSLSNWLLFVVYGYDDRVMDDRVAQEVESIVCNMVQILLISTRDAIVDSRYLSGGVWERFVKWFAPLLIERYSVEQDIKLTEQSMADHVYDIMITVALICQINEADMQSIVDDVTFNKLLYSECIQFLIPYDIHHPAAQTYLGHFCLPHDHALMKNFLPISDRHRYQQQSFIKLITNQFNTAQHGLTPTHMSADLLTPVQLNISELVCGKPDDRRLFGDTKRYLRLKMTANGGVRLDLYRLLTAYLPLFTNAGEVKTI